MSSSKGANKRSLSGEVEDKGEDEGNTKRQKNYGEYTNGNTPDSCELYVQLSTMITVSEGTVSEGTVSEGTVSERTVSEETSPITLVKVGTLIDDLNNTMTGSVAKLTKEQVHDLSLRVNQLIRDTYLVQEITDELSREPSVDILKQVFHGLIEYYVAMGYYVREQAPEVLTQMGALLAGSAIVGASIHQTFNIKYPAIDGNILMALASYLPPASAFSSGLYLLQRGGVNISGTAVSCVQGVQGGVQEGCEELLKLASTTIQRLLEDSDDYSVASPTIPASSARSVSSADSDSSVLSDARTEIKKLWEDAEKPGNLKEGAPEGFFPEDPLLEGPLSPLTMKDFSQDPSQDPSQDSTGSKEFWSAQGSLKSPGLSQETGFTGDGGIPLVDKDTQKITDPESTDPKEGGKRKGKSRRHTKFRKTKRRVKKNRRLTKKGKKHYKTLKRYRRKMRR